MTTIIGAHLDSNGNTVAIFDTTTNETIQTWRPVLFDEDFLGAGHSAVLPVAPTAIAGYPWVKKLVGAATVGIVPNAAGGVMQCALTSASTKQEATLYFNDQLQFDATKSLTWEATVSFPVLPSAAGVEAVMGLQSAWIDGPDNAAFYLQFQMNGSGLVNMRTKDGINTIAGFSGTVLTAAAPHNFKFSVDSAGGVRFAIDGLDTSVSGQFTVAATGANAVLQPYFSCYKPSGVGVATMAIDMIQASANRTA
jgi:hypothetical protein